MSDLRLWSVKQEPEGDVIVRDWRGDLWERCYDGDGWIGRARECIPWTEVPHVTKVYQCQR